VAVAVRFGGELIDELLGRYVVVGERKQQPARSAVVVLARQPYDVIDAFGGLGDRPGVAAVDAGVLGQIFWQRRWQIADQLRDLLRRQYTAGAREVLVQRATTIQDRFDLV